MRQICGIGVGEINQSLAWWQEAGGERVMIMMKDCAIHERLAYAVITMPILMQHIYTV